MVTHPRTKSSEVSHQCRPALEGSSLALPVHPPVVAASLHREHAGHAAASVLVGEMHDDVDRLLDDATRQAVVPRKPRILHHVLHCLVESKLRILGMDRGHASVMTGHQRLANSRHLLPARLAEQQAINRISTALRMARTLDEMLPLLLDETLSVFHTTAGSLWLYDPATQQLRRMAARGWSEQTVETLRSTEGIGGHVFTTREPYLAQNISADTHVHEASRPAIPHNWAGLVVPIRVEAEPIGTLSISIPSPRTFGPAAVGLLTTIAEIAGSTIHRVKLHLQTEQRLQRLTAMRSIDLAILNSMDLRVTLSILLGQITDQLQVDAVAVLLLSPHLQTLEYASGRGFRSRGIERSRLRLGEGYAGRAALEHRTVNIPDIRQAGVAAVRAPLIADENFVAYFGAPLLAKGQLKGVLEIFHRAPLTPDAKNDIEVATTRLAQLDSACAARGVRFAFLLMPTRAVDDMAIEPMMIEAGKRAGVPVLDRRYVLATRTGRPPPSQSGTRQFGYSSTVPGRFCGRRSPTASARDTPSSAAGVRAR